MNADPCSTGIDSRLLTAELPADGATLATSLSRGLMLVVHTGNAHLGVPVDRPLLRGLARAQGAADRAFHGYWPRAQAGSPVASGVATDDDASVALLDLPDVIPFRHATSHTFAVSGTDIQLTLHATRDPTRPDVHVELLVSRPLLTQLAQYQHRLRRKARIATLVGLLATLGALVALVALLALRE